MPICPMCKRTLKFYEEPVAFAGMKNYYGCPQCAGLIKELNAAAIENDELLIESAKNAVKNATNNKDFLDIVLKTFNYDPNKVKEYDFDTEIQNCILDPEKASQEVIEERKEKLRRLREIPVTTTDLPIEYDVIAPIIYNTTNRGIWGSSYAKLKERYLSNPFKQLLVKPEKQSFISGNFGTFLLSTLDGSATFEGGVGQGEFDNAFYYCVAEMKLRCAQMGGDAIVGLKMDYDLDTVNFGAFYLQMYGTVVKFKNKNTDE